MNIYLDSKLNILDFGAQSSKFNVIVTTCMSKTYEAHASNLEPTLIWTKQSTAVVRLQIYNLKSVTCLATEMAT